MICSKGQLVRLTRAAALRHSMHNDDTSMVIAIVYPGQPEGERGVQLDKALDGFNWWLEKDLEAVTTSADEQNE